MSAIEVVFICLISLFLLMGCVGFGQYSYSLESSDLNKDNLSYSDCVVFCSNEMYDRGCIQSSTNYNATFKDLDKGMYLCSCALIKCNKPKEGVEK
jgi:hypothetical protein